MKKPAAVASKGMALAHYGSADFEGKRHFVLFDPIIAMKSLKEWFETAEEYNQSVGRSDIADAISSGAVAVMEIIEEVDDTWSGKRVASEPGWGPTMYELMMMRAPNGFTSDRRGMSSIDTFPVWKKYMNREDVQKIPLENPRDFHIHSEWQSLAFKIPDDGSFETLASNYDRFLLDAIASHSAFSRTGYITKEKLSLSNIVGKMFGKRYRESGHYGEGEDYII